MTSLTRNVVVVREDERVTTSMHLIAEALISIRVQGAPYADVMRTPGAEEAHVAGFCLAEGIVDGLEDFASIECGGAGESNVAAVVVTEERRERIVGILDRRSSSSQTPSGFRGKPLTNDAPPLDARAALDRLVHLSEHQPLREETRGAHAAAIYGPELELLSAAEDVGRHNALDKAVGRLLLDSRLTDARLLTLSSRISFELVQKAARARIPVVLAISRPTALAVAVAEELNITLATLGTGGTLMVYCNPHRLV